MKSSRLMLYLIGFIVLVLALILLGRRVKVSTNTALVDDYSGKVEVQSKGDSDWRPLADGKTIKVGDKIRTQPKSEVDLGWPDRTHLRLAENSTLTIDESVTDHTALKTEAKVTLLAGKLWVRMRMRPTQKIHMTVNAGQLSARGGIIYNIAIIPEENKIRCENYKGEMQIKALDAGKNYELSREQAYDFPTGKKPQKYWLKPADKTAWQLEPQVSGAFVSILTPQEGAHVSESPLTVSGYTDFGNLVKVNNIDANVDESGMWTIHTSITKGINTIKVSATDEEGRQTELVRKVTY
jgi:hypothetical protein